MLHQLVRHTRPPSLGPRHLLMRGLACRWGSTLRYAAVPASDGALSHLPRRDVPRLARAAPSRQAHNTSDGAQGAAPWRLSRASPHAVGRPTGRAAVVCRSMTPAASGLRCSRLRRACRRRCRGGSLSRAASIAGAGLRGRGADDPEVQHPRVSLATPLEPVAKLLGGQAQPAFDGALGHARAVDPGRFARVQVAQGRHVLRQVLLPTAREKPLRFFRRKLAEVDRHVCRSSAQHRKR
jgi:hypothetical protein